MWHEDDGMMAIYASLEDGHGAFPGTCPVCGGDHAHVLMHRPDPSSPRGTVWAWCGTCGGYAHFSAVVPAWWHDPDFVDEGRLDSFVDYPDSISAEIDGWLNALLE